jgi:hypothetical protein
MAICFSGNTVRRRLVESQLVCHIHNKSLYHFKTCSSQGNFLFVHQISEVMEEQESNVLQKTLESATPCEVVPCRVVHISGRFLNLISDCLYSFQVPGLVPC